MVQRMIQRALNDVLYHVSGYISFYGHRMNENHKQMCLPSTLVGLAGRQVPQGKAVSDAGSCC